MRAFIRKWGNSAAVRLPASTLAATGSALKDPIHVRAEGGRIIVEKAEPRPITLDWLLEGITPENRHEETDWDRREVGSIGEPRLYSGWSLTRQSL